MTEKSCNLSEYQVHSLENKEVEPVEQVQLNIYQSNIEICLKLAPLLQ